VSKLTFAESLNVRFCENIGNKMKLRRETNIALFMYCDWFLWISNGKSNKFFFSHSFLLKVLFNVFLYILQVVSNVYNSEIF